MSLAASSGMKDVQLGILCKNKEAYDAYVGSSTASPTSDPTYMDQLKMAMKHRLDLQDKNGNTALHVAVMKGGVFADSEVFLSQYILDQIRDYAMIGSKDIQNAAGNTPLMMAAQYGRLDDIELLLAGGSRLEAEKNAQNNNGDSAIMIAARTGNIAVVHKIDERGVGKVDLNIKNRVYNQTALMIAAKAGYIDIVRFLINKGADPNIKGSLGKSALDFAVSNGHPSIAHFLMDRGAAYRLRGSQVSST